ncbi:MAG TPA: acyl-CoA dehydrogenase family protein [Actinophytocola sp.]|uniref:acyl-CoA dehydrogenase family protein n=1 Tax=Actinophytocola sp. TaxID=1872138 RepID=UPI002DBBD1BE|nr:acyl-CoA dehydrogenase family protein [Actinophytocola sp.]HEU5470737.1 acyl-CoA dehydrogenase family protein [Actinophytocola sp.]
MDIDLGPEAARFRQSMREWIAGNAPDGLATLTDWNVTGMTGGNPVNAEAERSPLYAEWERRLRAANLICAWWPEKFGGRGLTPVQHAIFTEELSRAGLPYVRRGFGEAMVGPSIMAHGTPEQQEYFLPRIISAEDVYCQGFSEPNHGSDLAGVQTKAVLDGDELVITGQKVWTSAWYRANMIFILCRTDPDAPKHRGLSYVLVPFLDNNILARPLKQMTGAAEFGEEFFDGARAPLFNVIGGLNNGWRVAMTTLGFERGGGVSTAYLRYEKQFWDLVELARKVGRERDPVVRQELAWAYSHVQIMRFTGLRALARLASGQEPGPEASTTKLFWSEYERRLGEIAADLLGAEGMIRPAGDGYPISPWQEVFLASRAGTIYSGTSEIQRNIIAERALGLPRAGSAS